MFTQLFKLQPLLVIRNNVTFDIVTSKTTDLKKIRVTIIAKKEKKLKLGYHILRR